jgi:hypothetical protein
MTTRAKKASLESHVLHELWKRAAGGSVMFNHEHRNAGQSHDVKSGGQTKAELQKLACSRLMCRLGLKNRREFQKYSLNHHPDRSDREQDIVDYPEALECANQQFYCDMKTGSEEKEKVDFDAFTDHTKEIVLAIDNMDVSKKEKEALKTEFKDAKKGLDATLKSFHVDDYVKAFADIIMILFQGIWKQLQRMIEGFTASKDLVNDTARDIVETSTSENQRNGWWHSIKEGVKAVAKVLGKFAQLLYKGIQVLGKVGFSMGKWIISNPSTARLALSLAIYYRNKLCRRIANLIVENQPLGSDIFTFDFGAASTLTMNGVVGGVRQFAKTSLFDQAFALGSSFAGKVTKRLLSWIPVGGDILIAAAETGTDYIADALKEATRETIILWTYQKDVVEAFTLLINLVDLRECWTQYQGEARVVQDRLAQLTPKLEVTPIDDGGSVGILREGGHSSSIATEQQNALTGLQQLHKSNVIAFDCAAERAIRDHKVSPAAIHEIRRSDDIKLRTGGGSSNPSSRYRAYGDPMLYMANCEKSDCKYPNATHIIMYSSCRGCAAFNTYYYNVQQLSNNIKLLGEEERGPTDLHIVGGSTTTVLYFRKTDSRPGQITLGEATGDRKPTGNTIVYTVSSETWTGAREGVVHENGSSSLSCSLADGTIVADGKSIQQDCNTCACKSGSLVCTELLCRATHKLPEGLT